jgi:hypothetical protein
MFVSFVDVSDCGAIADFWFLTDRSTDNGFPDLGFVLIFCIYSRIFELVRHSIFVLVFLMWGIYW